MQAFKPGYSTKFRINHSKIQQLFQFTKYFSLSMHQKIIYRLNVAHIAYFLVKNCRSMKDYV